MIMPPCLHAVQDAGAHLKELPRAKAFCLVMAVWRWPALASTQVDAVDREGGGKVVADLASMIKKGVSAIVSGTPMMYIATAQAVHPEGIHQRQCRNGAEGAATFEGCHNRRRRCLAR